MSVSRRTSPHDKPRVTKRVLNNTARGCAATKAPNSPRRVLTNRSTAPRPRAYAVQHAAPLEQSVERAIRQQGYWLHAISRKETRRQAIRLACVTRSCSARMRAAVTTLMVRPSQVNEHAADQPCRCAAMEVETLRRASLRASCCIVPS